MDHVAGQVLVLGGNAALLVGVAEQGAVAQPEVATRIGFLAAQPLGHGGGRRGLSCDWADGEGAQGLAQGRQQILGGLRRGGVHDHQPFRRYCAAIFRPVGQRAPPGATQCVPAAGRSACPSSFC